MVDRCVSVTETETEKVYLADFLKTNLTNSNELRKRKGEKERARRRKGGEEKQAMVATGIRSMESYVMIHVMMS